VIVEWLDAYKNDSETTSDGGAAGHMPYSATSAGILIRSDAEGVSLTLDEWRDPAEDLAVTQQGRQSFIPRAMITREIQIPAARWRRMVRPKGSIRKASAPKLTGTP
jgi:hypothetical protein